MLWRNRTWVKPVVKWTAAMLLACLASATIALAQPSKSASGECIDCGQVATDVALMVKAIQMSGDPLPGWTTRGEDWYTRTVTAHARKALQTNNPAAYVRELHKACLLEVV